MMISSITAVRVIIGHAQRRPCGSELRIFSPASPAKRRAYGSWNRASGRSLSIARYMATQRAVSETDEMGFGSGRLMTRQNVTCATIFRSRPEAVAQLVGQRDFNP